ncbi:hypothetical protein C8Q73DRAFT_202499 [Cubamyces lactineus]|nr:hypothetical protein C8Q73DRAFT_202499 [Cubamyces lactineus]
MHFLWLVLPRIVWITRLLASYALMAPTLLPEHANGLSGRPCRLRVCIPAHCPRVAHVRTMLHAKLRSGRAYRTMYLQYAHAADGCSSVMTEAS